MKSILLLSLFALVAAQSNFYFCEVVVPDFCAEAGTARDCLSAPSVTLQGKSYSLTDNFNVISFDSFNAVSSDIEGRLIVKNNGNIGSGYSIGALVYSKGVGAIDQVLPYSAIFGRDLTWGSGEVLPTGNDQGVAAYQEFLYVGGDFTTDANNLKGRVGSNLESEGSFDSSLAQAQQFYTKLQAAFDAATDNVNIAVQYGTATITCPAGASAYYGHIDTATFNTITSYAFDGCAPGVQMVITVRDDGVNQVNIHSGGMNPADRFAERTVFNILGSGRTIDVASVAFVGSILSPNNVYQATGSVVQGIVVVANILASGQFNRVNCSVPATPATPSPCVSFEGTCAGTLFTAPGATIQGDTRDYNVISFGSFVANTGDVEGRVMVRNDFTVGNGYSVGYELSTSNNIPDRSNSYSLIAGGDCTWGNGALYPDGSNLPYAGNAERAFCGSSFTGPADLTAKNAGPCATAGCLDAVFDAAKGCYDGYASTLASSVDNVDHTIADSALQITCNSATDTSYTVTVTDVEMNQFTYYVLNNCNFQAYWTVNVIGTGPVRLTGDSFPAVAGAVVYNVQNCRTINVYDTAVNGHILSTCSTLNQTGGVILGKVVVGDVAMSLQINKEDVCRQITVINVPIKNGPTTPTTPDTFCPTNPTVVQPGDILYSDNYNNGQTTIVAKNNGCVTTEDSAITLIATNSKVGYVSKASNAGNGNVPNISGDNSSATIVCVSVALMAIIALLF